MSKTCSDPFWRFAILPCMFHLFLSEENWFRFIQVWPNRTTCVFDCKSVFAAASDKRVKGRPMTIWRMISEYISEPCTEVLWYVCQNVCRTLWWLYNIIILLWYEWKPENRSRSVYQLVGHASQRQNVRISCET